MRARSTGWFVWLVIVLGAMPATTRCADVAHTVEATHGVVVSVNAHGSLAGLGVLQDGGNAVDAAVATAFALAVTHPEAGNIGGGGFMMVNLPGADEPVCVEYRETAPAAATPTMFNLDDSRHGHKIVGVPGTVRGFALAHEHFGTMPWDRLVEPAIELAADGFEVDAPLAESLNKVFDDGAGDFAEFARVYGRPGGGRWQPGDRLTQPDLAHTLREIAQQGADAFYSGRVAEQIVAEMQAGGGLITATDLQAYRAHVRRPVRGTFRGFDVYGPPPPSSGGICLAQMLAVLERFDLRGQGRWSPDTLHVMIETMRRAFCDRARWLGDADFVSIPKCLTTKQYAAQLAADIDPRRATPSEQLADDIALAPEGDSTTHFSVIDGRGMAVSNTYTLERSYGARVVVRGAGFLLNNEMGDFNWMPGHTDRLGVIGTPPNQIAPHKRMLSSQTPVIVMRDGRVRLLTGSPGGRSIINTSLCVVLNVLEFDMDLRAAVDAPRMHHGWFPDAVIFEPDAFLEHCEALGQLRAMGHAFAPDPTLLGDAHSIAIDPETGVYRGVADTRRNGAAAGY